jgi:calcyphosin
MKPRYLINFLPRHCYNVSNNPKYVGGVETKEEILKAFIDHFEEHHHKNSCITNEDFENYYAALSASVEDDTYFDLVIRQVYKL